MRYIRRPQLYALILYHFLMSFVCCDLLKGWVTLTKDQRRCFVLSFFRCSVAMLYQTNCCTYMIDDVSCLILRYCNSKHLHTTYQQKKEYKENVFVLNRFVFLYTFCIIQMSIIQFIAYILIFLLYQKECLIHHCKYYQHQYKNDASNLSVIFIWHNLHDILSIDLKSIFLNPKGRYVYETPFNLLEVKEIHYYLACRKILLFKTQCSFLVSDEHTFVI